MEKFLSIKLKEILNGENLNLENIVEITDKLVIEIKKKEKRLEHDKISTLILNTLTENMLSKYSKKSLIIGIDDIYNDSDEENITKTHTLQQFVDSKIDMIDEDITLFDCIHPIVTGIVNTYYKRKKYCCWLKN